MAWSKKYKKSIDCSNAKGFSQKAHCAGRKKRQSGGTTKSKSVTENIMNITEQDRQLFAQMVEKYNLKKEGFLSNLFVKRLSKAVKNDRDIKSSIMKADKELESSRQRILQKLGSEEKVKEVLPLQVRKSLGFDF
jgi:hypothetical protein